MAPEVEEVPQQGESPEDYTRRVAAAKATQVARTHGADGQMILGADTEVVVDGRILGKPADSADAARMLRLLSGRAHEVVTAVILLSNWRTAEAVVVTRVWFSELTDVEIDWYVGSAEPMGKAGAYAIQGLGARFIERIDGSWSNVVGLPLATVHQLLGAVQ